MNCRELLGGLQLVWHYTTMDGAYGMLESRQLWATDIAMLNDTTEGFHGLSFLTSVWKDRAKGLSAAESGFLSQVLNGVEAQIMQGRWYVACVSKDMDSLPMWRSYGGGQPCAVALPVDAPLNVVGAADGLQDDSQSAPVSWHEVEYQATVKERLALECMEAVLRARRDNATFGDDLEMVTPWPVAGVADAVAATMETALLMKNEAFAYENEVRLIVRGDRSEAFAGVVHHRVSQLGVVGHVELSADNWHDTGSARGGRETSPMGSPGTARPIAWVQVGPCAQQSAAADGIRRYLSATRRHDVGVCTSEVPFR